MSKYPRSRRILKTKYLRTYLGKNKFSDKEYEVTDPKGKGGHFETVIEGYL